VVGAAGAETGFGGGALFNMGRGGGYDEGVAAGGGGRSAGGGCSGGGGGDDAGAEGAEGVGIDLHACGAAGEAEGSRRGDQKREKIGDNRRG